MPNNDLQGFVSWFLCFIPGLGTSLAFLDQPWDSIWEIEMRTEGNKEGLWNEFAKLEARMKMWESLVESRHTNEQQGGCGQLGGQDLDLCCLLSKTAKEQRLKTSGGGSWSDSGEEEDKEKNTEETFLMAQASNEVHSDSSYYSDDNSLLDDDEFQ
nr:hypothetical protein [Tanacetum cinerariifolium]